jgi:hypothetical protein
LYYFRDQQGLEVDFLFPGRRGRLWMVGCRTSRTPQPAMARPLVSLRHAMPNRLAPQVAVVPSLGRRKIAPPLKVLAPGVEALDMERFVKALTSD